MFRLNQKQENSVTVNGKYTGSLNILPEQVIKASLRATAEGVDLIFDKGLEKVAKHFDWEEVEGFDFNSKNSKSSHRETSVSRTVAFGLAGYAAKKKKSDISFGLIMILYTTSGNIELVAGRSYQNLGDIGTTAAGIEQLTLKSKCKKFKKFIIRHKH